MIGHGNIALDPSYILQEDYTKIQQQPQQKQGRPQITSQLQGIDANRDEQLQLVSEYMNKHTMLYTEIY